METDERLISPSRRKNNSPRGMTVMIIRSVGKIRSFKLSGRSVFWVILFLLIYIPSTVLIVNEYLELRYEHGVLSDLLRLQEKELGESRQAVLRSKQHVALLEEFVNNIQTNTYQEENNSDYKKSPGISQPAEEKIVNSENIPKVKQEKIVDTQDIVIQKEGSIITVDFKLVNLQKGEDALGGYIHIIAESRNVDPPQVWTYPREKLQDGFPVNYRRGELFIIKRFKPIHGRIDLVSSNTPPSVVRVVVYDQSGVLILEKEFEVSNAS